MSTILQRQSIQGVEIGAGPALALLVTAITLSFVGMNGYHMSNYLVAKLTTADSAFYAVWWWRVIGFGVAALEIPLGMSFITNYRLHGFKHIGVISQLSLAFLVAALAIGAGIGSQLADAETRNNQIAAADTTLGGYENAARAAKLDMQARLLATISIEDPHNRELAQLKIKQRYQLTMARIAKTTANDQAKKPLKITVDGSTLQIAIFCLLSGVASIGAFYLSSFHAVYIKQLVALLAFSLKSKADHDWESSAADFKTRQHEISPLHDKSHGILFKERVPARKLDQATPEATLSDDSTAGNTNPNPIQPNPKSMITKHVECPNCKVTFKATEAQLSHNAKGVIKCGECGQRFVGNDHLTHKPEAAKPETTEADKLPSANTLSWLKNATTESYHGVPIMLYATEKNFADPACFDAAILTPDKTKILYSHHNHSEYDWLKQLDNENHPDTKKFLKACDDYKLMAGANFNETPISDKFAGNSQAIHQQKQALKPAVNSTEIPREYPANSLEIPKSTNSPIIKAKNPKDMPHVDLSEIAKIDDSAEKLAMLEKTIDELSAKPESDGLLFSSTRAFKLLKMNYGPVQKLFSQKQAEGKISTKKPFHIVYKEPV